MKTFRHTVTFALALLVANCFTANTVSAQEDKLPSAKDVLMKHVEKTGGLEAYKSIKTLVAEGTISIPQANINGTMKMKMMLPGKMNVIADIGGVGKTVQGSDGKFVWSSNPMMGTRLLSGAEADQLLAQAEMNRFTDPAGYYKSMKNAGIVDIDGEKAYKIELVKKDDSKQSEFYSVKSGLLIQSIVKVNAAGMGEMEITNKLSGYKKTGKFTSSHKMVQVIPAAGNMEQIIEFDKFEYNAKVDESDFVPPADVKKLIDKEKSKEQID